MSTPYLRPLFVQGHALSIDITLKVLGVILSSNLSAFDHICRVISDSAQSLYALRVHGMNDTGLQTVSEQ